MFARKQKKSLLFLISLIGFSTISLGIGKSVRMEKYSELLLVDSVRYEAKLNFSTYVKVLYNDLGDTSLLYSAFEEAMIGYHNLDQSGKIRRKDILTVIDFSKASNQDRLFIIDLCDRRILHKSIVAHGVNSGTLYANRFSNLNDSKQSSLGFYVTTTT